MSQIKITLLLLILILVSKIGFSQSCFEMLPNMTGIDISSEQSDLEAAACELRQSLPEEFREQFKVYDFGFYSLNEYMQGGFQAVWDKMINEEINSSYYLIFGRQLQDSRGVSKLWIELKLPSIQNSNCNGKEDQIVATLNGLYNPFESPYDFVQSETEIMELVNILMNCEDCENEVDDDGDGFIDCEDMDCIVQAFSFQGKGNNSKRSTLDCIIPSTDEVTCILDYYEDLNIQGCKDTESALEFCSALIVLENLILPQQSEYEKLIQYIGTVRTMACNRCFDYELHCDFIDNWLYLINNSNNVTTGEVYQMALWCKGLRDEILARHMLQFGSDLLTALDIATWEFELFASLRFFRAVPPSARNYGMSRMITKMSTPVSSFSSLQHAQKFGINTYDDLGRIFKDLGWTRTGKSVEFHHLIEQRFAGKPLVQQWLGSNPNKWKSIVVAKGAAEHTPKFTTPWRNLIGYGNTPGSLGVTTSTAQLSHIKEAAKIVYKDYPEILIALGL